MSDEERPDKISFANSAYSQIYRFDDIWKNAYRHALTGNFSAWNLDLDTMWRELAGDLKQKYGFPSKEYDKVYKDIMNFNYKIFSTYPLNNGATIYGFNKPNEEHKLKVSKQYIYLMEKEIYLRELQNELGKGTKWTDEDADSM